MKNSDFRKIYDDAIMMPLDRQLLLVTDEVRMAVPPIVLLGQLKWSLHNRISTDRLRPLSGYMLTEDVHQTDTVTLDGLTKGERFTLKGVVYNKSTRKPMLVDGKQVTNSIDFTAKGNSEEVALKYQYNGLKSDAYHKDKNDDLVSFVYLYKDGILIDKEEDFDSFDQTIKLPSCGTEAWDYNTQQIVVSDGKKVRKVTELHVDSKKPENGSFDVSMSFKTDGLGKHRIVIFEYVYDNKGNLISKEADFDAESQTIYIDKTPNKTGDRTVMFLSILAGMLGLGVVTLFVTKRKKK